MSDFFKGDNDGDLGNASNGVPVYDPFSQYNNPSWTSPEHGGGSYGGGGTPFWIRQPDDGDPILSSPNPPADPTLNPDLTQSPIVFTGGGSDVRNPNAPVVTTVPTAPAENNNNLLIGLAVVGLAVVLLKK